jgi:tetrahydromethanopterin S-methyltransferase subunit H
MTDIQNHQTIWFPEIYEGRQGVYAQPHRVFTDEKLIELVQKRADEDGNWVIDNGFVGDNEDAMRKMMEWVSRPENILSVRGGQPR